MNKSLLFLVLSFLAVGVKAQPQATVKKDLRTSWMKIENGEFKVLDKKAAVKNTIYFNVEANEFPASHLSVQSARSFFLFFNGKLSGEYQGKRIFNLDSLSLAHGSSSVMVTVHQPGINQRDLKTMIITHRQNADGPGDLMRPATYFKDFVILSGLIIILISLIVVRLNPKLATDYLSVNRIFSLREADDAQANARLTSSSNVQFYLICSLLLGFYLMIIVRHLPDAYALPSYFIGGTFWVTVWQWLKLSLMIFSFFFIKILLVYAFTRLFGLKGLARIHFFNWVRLLLVVFGAFSVILFIYFIQRGQRADFFVLFLAFVIVTLVAWIFIVFLKLNNRSEHSMFHLFSYICATEIIPLLITVKVLFQ